jgi:valyl-tRNA synthetase
MSARATLAVALDVLHRLFAPHLPFVAEEVWSWWRDGSVHRCAWPDAGEAPGDAERGVYRAAADVLGAVRKAKSDAQRSLRTDVTRAVVRDTEPRLTLLGRAIDDVRAAGRIDDLVLEVADEFAVDVDLVASAG